MTWRKIKSAPKTGTPILAYCERGEFPFIIYWGYVGRYTSTDKMWLGNEHGALKDSDIAGWKRLPKT